MSLAHWWPLTEDLRDYVCGTYLTNNGATTASGKMGPCYYFNGSTNLTGTFDYNQSGLGNYPTELSVSLWVKIDSSWNAWGQIFTIGKEGTSWNDIRIGLDINNEKKIYFSISDSSGATGGSGPNYTLTPGQWYHIVGIYKNNNIEMYVDGTKISFYQTSIVPNLQTASIVAIGGNSSEKQPCYISDVRVYN